MAKRTEMERLEEAQPLTIRLPREVHEALRTYAFVTKQTMNDVVGRAIVAYLAGEGRQQEMDEIIKHIQDTRRLALDKLAGM